MTSVGEAISRFTNSVGDTISVTFKNISDFIDSVLTFFVSMGFWTSVIIFFLLFFVLVSSPLLLFRYWDSIMEQYKKVTKSLVSSIRKG